MRARDNPFSIDRVLRVRYRPWDTNWTELMSRLANLNYHAAIVGAKGTGKTTLLEDLEPRLKSLGLVTAWLRLDAENRRFPPGFLKSFFAKLGKRDVVLFDGVEQMNWCRWRWFRHRCRRAGGLVVTSHAPGRLPTLVECRTNPELLTEIAAGILGTAPEQVALQANTLFHKHRGNLRQAMLDWYDLV